MAKSPVETRPRTRDATRARVTQGQITDTKILGIVKANPGLSIYQIAKIACVNTGLVDGSINRLREKNNVDIHNVLREGRRIKEVYPRGFVQYHEPEIRIAADEIAQPEKWKDNAYVYALSRITIGISPSEEKEWTKKAFAKFKVPIKKGEKRSIVIPIPEPLEQFYLWNNSAADIAVNDDTCPRDHENRDHSYRRPAFKRSASGAQRDE